MIARMKPHAFVPIHLPSINGSLKNFKLACDNNGVNKGAAVWLFHFSMNQTAPAVINERLSAECTDKKHTQSASGKTRYFITNPQFVSFLLK